MTLLARLFTLGIAREATPASGGVATYAAPIRWIPATGPKPEDVIAPLRDESLRGNDSVLQNIYGGAVNSTFDYTLPHLYADVAGDHFRAIIGPDTISGGTGTLLSSATTAGATSITTGASIPAGSLIRIDTAAKTEYATTGTPTGTGPYTIPIVAAGNPVNGLTTGLAFNHPASAVVTRATTHTFAQDQRATAIPSYSLTDFNGVETRGYPGCIESDLSVKVDPKGAITADPKWMGFPSQSASNVAPGYSTAQPLLGWQWGMTLGGVVSTRGLTAEFDWKRAVEAIQASDGTQGPREVWPGAIELDFKLKAIFENNTDLNQFLGYTQAPVVCTFNQPLSFGGSVLTITSSGQKFTKFASDFSGSYLTADIESSGSANATDSGVSVVTLTNFVTTAY